MPTDLALATDMELIGLTYAAYIDATWEPPTTFTPATYRLELSWTGAVGAMVEYTTMEHDAARATDFLPQTWRFHRVAAGVLHSVRVQAISLGGNASGFTTAVDIVAAVDDVPPGLPTSVSADFAGTAAIAIWTAPTDADLADYLVKVYGSSGGTLYATYAQPRSPFEWSLAEHRRIRGSSLDPSLYITVQSRDQAGNTSAAVGVAATNAAPSTPTIVSFAIPFNEAIVFLAYTRPADFLDFEYIFKVGGVTESTIYAANDLLFYRIAAGGSYTVEVKARDVFGQLSSAAVSSAVTASQPLSLEFLRQDTVYSDSIGTSEAALAIYKNGTSVESGITYPIATWNWIEARRALLDRVQPISLAFGANVAFYVAASADGTTWTWYSGPLTSARVLTLIGTGALGSAAQTSAQAANVTTISLVADPYRCDLPALQECRYMRIYFRSDILAPTCVEYYPNTVVRASNIQAESIGTLLLAANAITADKIDAGALTAYLIGGNTIEAGDGAMVLDSVGQLFNSIYVGSEPKRRGPRWESDGNVTAVLYGTGSATDGAAYLMADPTDLNYPFDDAFAITIERSSSTIGQMRVLLNAVPRLTITTTLTTINNPLTVSGGNLTANSDAHIVGDATIGGSLTVTNHPSFSAYLGSNATISASTFTKIVCASEDFDATSAYSTSTGRFTPLVAGTYQVIARLGWTASLEDQKLLLAAIYKNGTRVLSGTTITSGTGDHGTLVTGLLAMNGSTDYLELYAYHECSASKTVYGGSLRGTTFSAVRVG
jgi:hypothetical protein